MSFPHLNRKTRISIAAAGAIFLVVATLLYITGGVQKGTGPTPKQTPTLTFTSAPSSSPSSSSANAIFFGSDDNNFYALTETGSQFWPPFTTGSYIDSSPILEGGALYFGSQDAYFYGIDAQTGTKKCKYQMGDRTVSSPVYANNLIYIGSQDHYVYAFTLDCKVQWNTKVSEAVDDSAAVADGVVYICSRDGHIYAFVAQTGKILWSQPKGASTPFVDNGVVYVGGDNLYALDARTGVEKWRFSSPQNGDFHSPFVVNGVVYVGAGGGDTHVYAVNANTGAKIWDFKAGGSVESVPRVVNHVIYIGSRDQPGHIYAINSANGMQIWMQTVPDQVYTSVTYASSTLYFGCQDDSLYALNANDGSFHQEFSTNGKYVTNGQVNSTPLVVPSDQL